MRPIIVFSFFAIFLSENIFADSKVAREVRAWGDGQWAVVDVRTVTGTVVVVNPVIGREINFEERNRLGIFEGETFYNRKQKLTVLKTPITGFQSAMFLKLGEGRYGVRVMFRNEMGMQHRLLPISDEEAWLRICGYLARATDFDPTSSTYPMETGEELSFETVRPRFRPYERLMGHLVLDDGEKVKGELLPVMEVGQLMVETKTGFRRVDVAAIQQVGIGGRGATGIFKKTLQGSIYWGLTGGFTGLMSGLFYQGVSAKEQMYYGAVIGASVGGIVGFLDGVLSIQTGKTFHLGSLDRKTHRQLEISPMGIRLRF